MQTSTSNSINFPELQKLKTTYSSAKELIQEIIVGAEGNPAEIQDWAEAIFQNPDFQELYPHISHSVVDKIADKIGVAPPSAQTDPFAALRALESHYPNAKPLIEEMIQLSKGDNNKSLTEALEKMFTSTVPGQESTTGPNFLAFCKAHKIYQRVINQIAKTIDWQANATGQLDDSTAAPCLKPPTDSLDAIKRLEEFYAKNPSDPNDPVNQFLNYVIQNSQSDPTHANKAAADWLGDPSNIALFTGNWNTLQALCGQLHCECPQQPPTIGQVATEIQNILNTYAPILQPGEVAFFKQLESDAQSAPSLAAFQSQLNSMLQDDGSNAFTKYGSDLTLVDVKFMMNLAGMDDSIDIPRVPAFDPSNPLCLRNNENQDWQVGSGGANGPRDAFYMLKSLEMASNDPSGPTGPETEVIQGILQIGYLMHQANPSHFSDEGIVFQNEEGLLPDGNYLEFGVPSPEASGSGTERIVINSDTGEAYLTTDHYTTFAQISGPNSELLQWALDHKASGSAASGSDLLV